MRCLSLWALILAPAYFTLLLFMIHTCLSPILSISIHTPSSPPPPTPRRGLLVARQPRARLMAHHRRHKHMRGRGSIHVIHHCVRLRRLLWPLLLLLLLGQRPPNGLPQQLVLHPAAVPIRGRRRGSSPSRRRGGGRNPPAAGGAHVGVPRVGAAVVTRHEGA